MIDSAEQGDLFGSQRTIRERWEKFHADNPHVYGLVCRFADELLALGFKRAGISLIWERLRWELAVETRRSAEEYRLNNDYRALYARLWLDMHPEHPEFFELRRLHEPVG